MRNVFWFSLLVALCCVAPEARAERWKKDSLQRLNDRLNGKLIDHSHNHGADNRIWSPALNERRDLYVYVPPGYAPRQRYPLILYLHGYVQDETTFLQALVEWFDEVMSNGKMPPAIIAFPDGSIQGKSTIKRNASFFLDSKAGNFEQFLMKDVWDFLFCKYPLRPEREAHVLVGISMGGAAAFRIPLAYPDRFKLIIGFMPALNLRWVDCNERYKSAFDPCCWGWRTKLRPYEPVGRFYGVVTIRFKELLDPLFGRGPDALAKLSAINPIELLETYDVRPGQFDMFIGYVGRDEFNIMAEVESYLFVAKKRGLPITVAYDPNGKHSLASGKVLFPDAIKWMAPLLAPYSPPAVVPACPQP